MPSYNLSHKEYAERKLDHLAFLTFHKNVRLGRALWGGEPIAFGANRGRKALTLQTLPPASGAASTERVAQSCGFSLHAGVAAEALERAKLERLCRYISRPAVASERLTRTADGRIRYSLKTPYRDGTTHVVFEPLDFLSRLAALVPSPGVNLLGTAPQARVRDRDATLRALRRGGQDHRQQRRPASHREDSRPGGARAYGAEAASSGGAGAAVGHERGIRVSPRNAARRRPRLGVEGSARTRISR